MSERPDPRELLAGLGFAPDAVRPVLGGADATLWRVSAGGGEYALRLLSATQGRQATRELAAMRAVRTAGLPVPEDVASAVWHDRPVILMTWAPGVPLAAAVRSEPDRAREFGRLLGATQASIHRVPPPAALANDNWVQWQPPDDDLATMLSHLPPAPPALLHLDLHPLNLLSDGTAITAILDWANVRIGDPTADRARTEAILSLAPLPLPAATAASVREELLAGWREGLGPIGSDDSTPFLAWAGGVLIQELAPRQGKPGLGWVTAGWLESARLWTNFHRGRLGLEPLPASSSTARQKYRPGNHTGWALARPLCCGRCGLRK